jgi:ketosteroid isomerase-like protein
MSEKNVRIVRDGYDAFNRRDIEAVLTNMDPSIEWWPAADEPIVQPYRGYAGYRMLVDEIREAVPDIQAEVEEVFAVDDHVVTCLRFWGRGRDSGAPVEVRETNVARFRDGKIVEVREYRERGEALEALGLKA